MTSSLLSHLPSHQKLYYMSPRAVKWILVNLEAWRRDRFRRYGDYRTKQAYYDPSWYTNDPGVQEAHQVERLKTLLLTARQQVPYYRANLPAVEISNLQDLQKLPILEKAMVRHDPEALVSDHASPRDLRHGITSGSTGTPLRFYLDRTAIQAHIVLVPEPLLAMHDCHFGERRVRFSGAQVAPYEQNEPPFWIYIGRYHQLQCSAYHLGPDTYPQYLRAIDEAKCRYGTGYATAWHLLASYILESGVVPPRLKAIFTDSEGISLEQQATVERAFGCPVIQIYGLGEVGQAAIQCKRKHYHVLTRSCITEIVDDNDTPVQPGETGHIIVTDLTSFVTPFIRYRTGDLATLAPQACKCGWNSPCWTEVVGRVDDRIKTPEGRWIGRLSHVTKPGIGIRESQIVQTATDRIVIKVVPEHEFDPASMDEVLAAAHRYMGQSMHITWELVDKLERTPRGKLRHVVRKVDL